MPIPIPKKRKEAFAVRESNGHKYERKQKSKIQYH